MARRNDDDDYDDRPRRRRPADDEDDDVDDRVSSRKRPGARGGDYDDEDDYDRPRKKKKAGSKGLIIGLSVGGGVLVLVIVGVVFFSCFVEAEAAAIRKSSWSAPGSSRALPWHSRCNSPPTATSSETWAFSRSITNTR